MHNPHAASRAPQKPQGVIFDLGGTLIVSEATEERNTEHLLRWAAERGLGAIPEALPAIREARRWMWDETVATGRQVTAREAISRGAARLGWTVDEAWLEQATHAFFGPEVSGARPYPDAMAALLTLRDLGLRLGVISNASDHRLVEEILAGIGLAAFFDPVVSSAGFGWVKPAPQIFQSVASAWSLPPEACVMVGDLLETDIAGAQAAGMRTILATMAGNPTHGSPDADATNAWPADSVQPDARTDSLLGVVEIIKGWMALEQA